MLEKYYCRIAVLLHSFSGFLYRPVPEKGY